MHASITIPALFSILSTFMIGCGLGNVFLSIPHHSTILTSTKFSIVPLSTSMLAVAVPQVCLKTTLISREFLWLTYTQSKDMARTQATQVEPSKKMRRVDHSRSTHPITVSFLSHLSPVSLLAWPFCLGLQLPHLHWQVCCYWFQLFR